MKKIIFAAIALMLCVNTFFLSSCCMFPSNFDIIEIVDRVFDALEEDSGAENPMDYNYYDRYEDMYIGGRGEAIALYHSSSLEITYVSKGIGVVRIGVSNDLAGVWSKVVYNGSVYYVLSENLSYYSSEMPDIWSTVEEAYPNTESSTDGGYSGTGIGDPGEYEYTACNETVYVSSSAATLRAADYEAKGSLARGTALTRIGISNDENGYWSKVVYEGEVYYVASKLLTDIADPDEGFVAVNKTVVINEKTGSLNIRSLPSYYGSEIIGYAIAGVEITVIAENITTGWYKVQFVAYGGETMIGYMGCDERYFESGEAATEYEEISETEEPPSVGK